MAVSVCNSFQSQSLQIDLKDSTYYYIKSLTESHNNDLI